MMHICNDTRCTRKHPSPGSTSHINSLQLLSFIQYVQRRMLHPQLHRLDAPQPYLININSFQLSLFM